jgi:hypothetical protein
MTGIFLKHAELTEAIFGSFYDVYHELGHASWSRFIAKP